MKRESAMRTSGVEQAARVLGVDDRPAHRDRLVRWLSAEGYDCAWAERPADVSAHLQSPGLGGVVVEVETAANRGPEVARLFQDHSPATSVLAIAREGFSAAAIR